MRTTRRRASQSGLDRQRGAKLALLRDRFGMLVYATERDPMTHAPGGELDALLRTTCGIDASLELLARPFAFVNPP